MRILRISHSAAVTDWRGRERGLRALGQHIDLLSARRWHAGGAETDLALGVDEQAIPVDTWGRHPALFVYDPRPLWRALGETYDVIDVHEEPFALATAEVLLLRWLRRNHAPVVLYTAQNLHKRYPPPFRWWERSALRHASGISACNTEAARIAERKGFAGRARVIPLGVDLDRYTPQPASPEPRDTIVVGFLGRLVTEKGLHTLIDTAALEPRLRLRIAGTGPLSGRLHAEVAARGLTDRVDLLGAIDPDAVPAFYSTLDVLAVPSIPRAGWTEQFGRVAVEAMASGVPVVSSDAGALPDVVGGAGLVVPAGDATALATALVEAATTRAPELREAGLARAAECSWDAVAHAYADLYGSVTSNGPRGTAEAAAAVAGPERNGGRSEQRRPLEIIVVAFGAPDLLRRALEPVRDLPVTVVDNSSLPEIAALCDAVGVRYIDSGRNGGFAAGVNVALRDRLVPGADVLLLNPDAVISADAIAVLHDALAADRGPRVGRSRADRRPRPSGAGRVAVPEPGQRVARGRRTRAVAARGALRDRLGAAAARGGAGSGRRLRRAILPLRRRDRLGLSRAPARVAPHGGPRTHAPCMRARRPAPIPADARLISSHRRSGSTASTSVPPDGSRRGPRCGSVRRCALCCCEATVRRRPDDGLRSSGVVLSASRRGSTRRRSSEEAAREARTPARAHRNRAQRSDSTERAPHALVA